MPATPVFQIPYPPGNVVPNVPKDMQALAEGAEGAILGVATGGFSTTNAAWSSASLALDKVGRLVLPAGGPRPVVITPPSTGPSITLTTALTDVGTIAPGYRPLRPTRFTAQVSGSALEFEVIISNSGAVQYRAYSGTVTLTPTSGVYWDGNPWVAA